MATKYKYTDLKYSEYVGKDKDYSLHFSITPSEIRIRVQDMVNGKPNHYGCHWIASRDVPTPDDFTFFLSQSQGPEDVIIRIGINPKTNQPGQPKWISCFIDGKEYKLHGGKKQYISRDYYRQLDCLSLEELERNAAEGKEQDEREEYEEYLKECYKKGKEPIDFDNYFLPDSDFDNW
jgi:hypothetical protein